MQKLLLYGFLSLVVWVFNSCVSGRPLEAEPSGDYVVTILAYDMDAGISRVISDSYAGRQIMSNSFSQNFWTAGTVKIEFHIRSNPASLNELESELRGLPNVLKVAVEKY
jgi:hypothetical protein